MSRPQFSRRTHRARQALDAVGRAYPTAWAQADALRAGRGHGGLPDWPDWCYLPLHGAYAIVSGAQHVDSVPLASAHHIGIVGALAAWRMGQDIIRYDPALYEAMITTQVGGDLPVALLYRLPCWCVYIETPGLTWRGSALHGVWAHLDWSDGAPPELRLVLDVATDPGQPLATAGGLTPLPIILGAGTIADALDRMIASGARQAAAIGLHMDAPSHADTESAMRELEPIMSLVLYLCSERPDWPERGAPHNPLPVRTRRDGWRLFAADAPRTWDVGVRLGAALRQAYAAQEVGRAPPGAAGHASPRPHIRRAHWHGFWSGARVRPDGTEVHSAERRYEVRWMPPIPVRLADPAELPAVVHPVRGGRP